MGNYDNIPVDTSSTPASNYDDIPVATTSTPTVSTGEAFGRGFANNASFGLGKVVNGIVGAAINKWDDNPGDVVSSIASSTPKTGQGFWADVGASIKGQREANQAAYDQHKLAYGAGAVIGAAPSILATGGAQTATRATLTGAGLGAVEGGADSSNLKELGTNASIGALAGGALSGLGTLAGNAVKQYGIKAAQQIISDTLDASRSANPVIAKAALDKLGTAVGIPSRFKVGDVLPSSASFKAGTKVTQEMVDASDEEIRNEAAHLHELIGNTAKMTPKQNQYMADLGGPANVNAKLVKRALNDLAPPFKQVVTEGLGTAAATAAGGAIGSGIGHFAEGIAPGYGTMVGGLLGGGTGLYHAGKAFAGDLAESAGLGYASSAPAQKLGSILSSSSGGASVGSNLPGMDGVLGQYLQGTWLNK